MTAVDIATVKPEVPRDRFGRPLIIPPVGGKPVAYTRATKIAETLDDRWNLEKWQQRQVALGLADRPDLLLAVAAHRDDKQRLNKICESAVEAANASAAATTGTALHALTDLIDLERELPVLPKDAQADLDAYRQATKDLVTLAVEQFVVLDDLQVAGTFDRLVLCPDGVHRIADLKGLALTTPLPTPTGWTTMQAVEVGDEVLDAHGQPCRVTAKSPVKQLPTFVVRFDDGAEIVCDNEHIWWTQAGRSYDLAPTVKPVREIVDTLTHNGQKTHRVPVAKPLNLPHTDLPIDPYVLGCWLGDGNKGRGVITKGADLFDVLTADGNALGVEQIDKRTGVISRTILGLQQQLREAGLLHDKHIPPVYLRGSYEQRLRLLQGLMDTDGTWNTARRTAVFNTTDKAFALAVEELLLTLGQRPHYASSLTSGFGLTVTSHAVQFTPNGLNPFRLPRKANQAAASTKNTFHASRRVIVAVEPGPDTRTACIAVDSPTRTYLCGERMVPTHNTGSTIDYSAGAIAIQLALYSRGVAYDPGSGRRTPLPDVDQDTAIVVHLPAGQATCTLHRIDIRYGWEAAQIAMRVRAYRRFARKGLLTPIG